MTDRESLGTHQFVINDRQPYDFLFTDRNKTVASPLISPCTLNDTHWNREVSIPTLSALPHKVLLFGSLFGGGRIQSDNPEAELWSESFARAVAFKSEWLLRPAEAIVARLGGPKNFVGVHARVGDGDFARHARQNMEQAWKRLVESLGYDEAEVEEMWEVVRAKGEEGILEVEEEKKKAKTKAKRHLEVAEKVQAERSALVNPPAQFSPWSPIDSSTDDYSFLISSPPSSSSSPPSTRLQKRAPVDGDDDPVWNFLRGPSGEPSAVLRNLNCRSPLHTDSNLKPLNIPLYLATDSRSPTTDPNLKPFFDAFPCTFILSDFDHPDEVRNDGVVVESVGEMARLENELDGVPLGRLFLPFLEAVVSAKGKITVGTAGSTFSGKPFPSLFDSEMRRTKTHLAFFFFFSFRDWSTSRRLPSSVDYPLLLFFLNLYRIYLVSQQTLLSSLCYHSIFLASHANPLSLPLCPSLLCLARSPERSVICLEYHRGFLPAMLLQLRPHAQ